MRTRFADIYVRQNVLRPVLRVAEGDPPNPRAALAGGLDLGVGISEAGIGVA